MLVALQICKLRCCIHSSRGSLQKIPKYFVPMVEKQNGACPDSIISKVNALSCLTVTKAKENVTQYVRAQIFAFASLRI